MIPNLTDFNLFLAYFICARKEVEYSIQGRQIAFQFCAHASNPNQSNQIMNIFMNMISDLNTRFISSR